MVMIVEFLSFSFTVAQMVFSVFGSTCAVGSSKITILLCCSNVRAKQISCRSPTLRFSPLSKSLKSSCPSRSSTRRFNLTSLMTWHSSLSLCLFKGSRFVLSEALKRTGDWLSTEMHLRDSCSWTLFTETSEKYRFVTKSSEICTWRERSFREF